MARELPNVPPADSLPVEVRKQLAEVVQLLHLAGSVRTETILLLSLMSVSAARFRSRSAGACLHGVRARHIHRRLDRQPANAPARERGGRASRKDIRGFLRHHGPEAVRRKSLRGALGDLAGIVPLLIVAAIMYCATGLLALFLLGRPQTRGKNIRISGEKRAGIRTPGPRCVRITWWLCYPLSGDRSPAI